MSHEVLQQVEEKVLLLIQELESLRQEVRFLVKQNTDLMSEQSNHLTKLEGLVSLLDMVDLSAVKAEDLVSA